jgi:tetratricopeptide (TPR) repeat protein
MLAAVPAAAGSAPVKPWEEGVSRADQARARALFDEGNALLIKGSIIQALVRYERAVTIWDHPAIRFNMAIVLIKLDRPIEAYQSIERALRHGPDALEPSEYAQAQNYKLLLEGQVARLMVTCDEPGARVTLDGKYLFTGPGEVTTMVLTGEHQVVAGKPGRLTQTYSPRVMPRILNRVDLGRLLEETPVVRRRWPRLQPWALVGLGAATTLVGVPLQMRAQANLDEFRQAIDAQCGATGSCKRSELPRDLLVMESRGKLQNRAALVSFTAGGVLLATGLTLVILNQPRPVTDTRPSLIIAPQIDGENIGISAAGRF